MCTGILLDLVSYTEQDEAAKEGPGLALDLRLEQACVGRTAQSTTLTPTSIQGQRKPGRPRTQGDTQKVGRQS